MFPLVGGLTYSLRRKIPVRWRRFPTVTLQTTTRAITCSELKISVFERSDQTIGGPNLLHDISGQACWFQFQVSTRWGPGPTPTTLNLNQTVASVPAWKRRGVSQLQCLYMAALKHAQEPYGRLHQGFFGVNGWFSWSQWRQLGLNLIDSLDIWNWDGPWLWIAVSTSCWSEGSD